MKTMNRVLAVAAMTAVLGLSASAMGSDDGIAASPKLRMQLNERKAKRVATPTVTVVTKKAAPANLASSPKVEKMFAERTQIKTLGVEPSTAAPANGWIAASPKVRQQLTERGQVFEIAPLK